MTKLSPSASAMSADRPLIVFDLDDTLFPEREFAMSGFGAVARQFASILGDPAKSLSRMQALFDSTHRRRVFDALLHELGIGQTPALINDLINAYRSHDPVIHLFPDADDALRRLRPHAYLGIISDGPLVMQQTKVSALGLASRLDAVILTAELGDGFGKPHPRAFEVAAARFDLPSTLCTYVADNLAKDFLAPNQLGWRTIQVVRSGAIYGGATSPPGGEPAIRIHSLDELTLKPF